MSRPTRYPVPVPAQQASLRPPRPTGGVRNTAYAEARPSDFAAAPSAAGVPDALAKAKAEAQKRKAERLQAEEAAKRRKEEELRRVAEAEEQEAEVEVEEEDEEVKAERENRERELEDSSSRQLEEMLPPAMEKTDTAEDEVEKVAIAAAPLQIEGSDDLRPVMLQAIKETEQRVRAALASLGEARRYISAKLSQVSRFPPNAKKTAVEEFTSLQARLTEASKKLEPFKTVRQDYEKRAAAQKLHTELSSKVAGAEIEVEKAAMLTAPLGGDTAEGMKETEAALGAAQAALAQTTRLIDSKLKGNEKLLSGPFKDEMKALQDRVKAAQTKLDEVKRTVKETQVRVAADALLREVAEKVSGAEDELQRMAEAELPFLRSEQKPQEMEGHMAEAEKAATKAQAAISEAQTFVAKKLVEVARFIEGPAKAVKEEIDMFQKRLEEGRERLQQFRSNMADRKRSLLLEEVEAKVKSAEEESLRMAEAMQALNHLGAAGDAAGEGCAEAVEQANLAERAAQASLVVARKHLLHKTAELKKLAVAGAGSGSELGRLQTRVNHVQQEIAKFRAATKDAEERLKVKQMLSEVVVRLVTAEGEVDKVAEAAVAAAKDQPTTEQVDRLEKATAAAQVKIGATAKLVDVKLKSAQGILRDELQGMRNKIASAEKKLATVLQAAKEQRERLSSADLLAEASELVRLAEAEVQKTGEAELPFLKGIEVGTTEAHDAIGLCESAAAAAQKAIGDARTYVVQKLVEVKEFSPGPAEACGKELSALQKRLDAGAAKLAELKRDSADRKRKMQMQASREKVASVEAAVQQLATAMAKFPDDRLAEMSREEAGGVCEELANSEVAAQAAVADAKKILAMRMQDAKTSADASKGTVVADLTRLQSRLTQCQVELAKLSRQATEREQRFVAQRLLQVADSNLAELRKDVQVAAKVVEDLSADDRRSALLTSEAVTSISAALLAHARSGASGATADSLFASVAGGGAATVSELAAWLARKLPEIVPGDAVCLSEERANAVASQVAGGATKQVTAAAFETLFRDRYVCIASTGVWSDVDGGEEVGQAEEGEGLELLGPLVDGAARARFALIRDGTQAWVPLDCVKLAPPFVGRLDSMEAVVKATHLRCSEASKAADQKFVELSQGDKVGPLAEVKNKYQELRLALGGEKAKVDALKKRAAMAKASLLQQRQEEAQQVQEALCRDFAARAVAEGSGAVEAAEVKANATIESARGTSPEAMSLGDLDKLKGSADEALDLLTKAKAAVAKAQEGLEAFKGASRKVILESKVELTKLASRATAAERKLKAATDGARTTHAQLLKKAVAQARSALRAAARRSGKTTDALFDAVAAGGSQISEAQFAKFVEGLPDHGLGAEQVGIAFREFAPIGALRRADFAKALQEFRTCARGTALAASREASAQAVRRLEPGEMVEVLEGPVEEPGSQAQWVRGRAIRDSVTGWVTMKDETGFLVLKPREKPFLFMAQGASLREAFDSAAPLVRELQKDEVLELVEGPRPQAVKAEMTLHCRASEDGAEGWITLRDAAGVESAERSQAYYVCRSTIAMTDVSDIPSCKVLRKVDVGESLLLLESDGAKQDAAPAEGGSKMSRLRFRATRDGCEGWVTLKGNMGTSYVEASGSHYTVRAETPLRADADVAAEAVRHLHPGELIEGLAPPVEAQKEAKVGLQARALEDGKAGWIIFTPGPKAPVKPYKGPVVARVSADATNGEEAQA